MKAHSPNNPSSPRTTLGPPPNPSALHLQNGYQAVLCSMGPNSWVLLMPRCILALALPASLSPFHRDCVTEPARTGCRGAVPEPGEELTCTLTGLCPCLSEAQAPTRTESTTDTAHSSRSRTYFNIASRGSGLLNSCNTLKNNNSADCCQPLPSRPNGRVSFLRLYMGKILPLNKKTTLAWTGGYGCPF